MQEIAKKHADKLRFAIVGSINTVIDFSILFVLTMLFNIPKELANPKAIGERETIVPTDVPEEADKNDAIKNTPTKIYSAERYFIPKLTIASTLPIDLDTVAKAPANK